MRIGATLLWAGLAGISAAGLFLLKSEVQGQEQRLTNLRKDIVEARNSVHVLNAEWSYLNDPSRLRGAAEHYLNLHPLKPAQFGSIDLFPLADPPQADGAPDNNLLSMSPSLPPVAPATPSPAKPARLASNQIPPSGRQLPGSR